MYFEVLNTPGKVPALLELPHGGRAIPRYAKPHLKLPSQELQKRNDDFSDELYFGVSSEIPTIRCDILRMILDVNRSSSGHIEICHSNGLVNTHTMKGMQIWKHPSGPGFGITRRLYAAGRNYHQELRNLVTSDCRLCLFCHTGQPRGNPGNPNTTDDNQPRPVAMLGIGSDEFVYCHESIAQHVRRSLEEFIDSELIIDKSADTNGENVGPLNQPFAGEHTIVNRGCADLLKKYERAGILLEFNDSVFKGPSGLHNILAVRGYIPRLVDEIVSGMPSV